MWTVVAIVVLGAASFGGWKIYDWFTVRMNPQLCYLTVDGQAEPLTLTHEQAGNAAIIVAESYNQGLSEQAAVIALATAWQESSLRNLDYGDRDSLGLFQQRPSYGWGTEEQIMDPWYSSSRFYEELVKFEGWETGDVNDVAQQVQRSGHPDAYRKHETNARALAGALRGSRPAALTCVQRDPGAGEHSTVDRILAAVPGITVANQEDRITISGGDGTAIWSATQLVIAFTQDIGITEATVATWTWRQPERRWNSTNDSATPTQAVVRYR